MNSGIFFQIISLVYVILLLIVYFSKKRLEIIENKIFISLLVTNFIGLIIDIFSVYTIKHIDTMPIINIIVTKSYLLYLLTWIFIFTFYILIISRKNDNSIKKIFSIIISFLVISYAIVIMLPLNYESANDIIYSYGPSADFTYLISGILIVIWIFVLLINLKQLKQKKYLPIFTFLVIGIGVIILQATNPGLLMMTSMETFITFLMYFTIENPDLQMIEQLNVAREQADKANQAKSDFLSSMSHEIRTPLNAIVGFSEALMEEELKESQKEEVKDIVMASNSLLEIVNGILDISKIEANKIEIVNGEYKFKDVFDNLVALSKGRLGDKPLDFKYHYDESIPTYLYGDSTRIKQIILNILTNSIKYTREGFVFFNVSSIIKDDVCRLIVSVEDSGIGIKEEAIPHLFSKFERLDIEKNITIEGTGLGLAITKKLIELMNGKIVVQSVYGKGSKFTISIDQKIIDKKEDEIEQTNVINDEKDLDLSDKHILIVDDNNLNLKVASRLLEKYHPNIETVNSGVSCIEKINNGNKYDLILMDDMMPSMSGIETLKKLKEIDGFNIPVVALTANAITGMKEKYLNEGFNDYLAKPIEKIELNKLLSRFF